MEKFKLTYSEKVLPNQEPFYLAQPTLAFRLLKIGSTEENLEKQLDELKHDFLLPRNYHAKIVESQFKRVKNLPGENYSERRKLALVKKEKVKTKNNRVIAPLDYNPLLPKMSEILTKHHKSMIFKKPELKSTFPEPPMAALRQPPNLRSLMCKSKLYLVKRSDRLQRNAQKTASGWKKCGKGSTTCCAYTLPSTNQVTGQVTGYQHTIKDSVTCETRNCVYYWKCKKADCKFFPKCEYVGPTHRSFKARMAEHKQYVRSTLLDKPSGFHFNQPGHDLSHFAGLVLEEVKSQDPFVLRAREFLYIQKFDTYRNGLNKEP